jgi:NADH-quinone oxidoreductase subunit L
MTLPLVVLAACAILLGFIGTPFWPWFQDFLNGQQVAGSEGSVIPLMVVSSLIVFAGLGLGWWFYGRKRLENAGQPDSLEQLRPDIFRLLQNKYFVDEFYEATIIRFTAWWSRACDWLDTWVWNGAVQLISYFVLGLSWLSRSADEFIVNLGFDEGCRGLTLGGKVLSRLQDGRVQHYLRVIGVAFTVLVLLLLWGCHTS